MEILQQVAVIGVFADRSHAQAAVRELRQSGFRENEIGVITRDETTGEEVRAEWSTGDPDHTEENIGAGAATGAAAGVGLGTLWALGIAAGVLPAIGPVIAGGLLASLLASAAGGALTGGLVGALVGFGVPEEEALFYEGEIQGGRTVVIVQADDRALEARAILTRHGANPRNNDL